MRQAERATRDKAEVEVDRLTRKHGKYALVVAVAKRARHMKERAARIPLGPSPASYVERALTDVAQGRVKVVHRPQE